MYIHATGIYVYNPKGRMLEIVASVALMHYSRAPQELSSSVLIPPHVSLLIKTYVFHS
jgi:hypothetical protein